MEKSRSVVCFRGYYDDDYDYDYGRGRRYDSYDYDYDDDRYRRTRTRSLPATSYDRPRDRYVFKLTDIERLYFLILKHAEKYVDSFQGSLAS